MQPNLTDNIAEALQARNLNTVFVLIHDYRRQCGFSFKQQREICQAYRLMMSWSIEEGVELPNSLIDNDLHSIEGALINQALIEVVICNTFASKQDAIASLCAQMCRGIMIHGVEKDEVIAYWTSMGIPPLLLARDPFFTNVREQHFMTDLGL